MAFPDGWHPFMRIPIVAGSGAGSDYQINLYLHYGVGDNSDGHVYFNGSCKTDFTDVRVASYPEKALLPITLKNVVAYNSATLVFKDTADCDVDHEVAVWSQNADAVDASDDSSVFIDSISGVTSAWLMDEDATDDSVADYSGDERHCEKQNYYPDLDAPAWTTIIGNPDERHNFQPVHKTRISEVNMTVDGASRKYLAYDCDPTGVEIRLYYTDDLDGAWTAYSGNPILGPSATHFRWPSVVWDGSTFHMFLCDITDTQLERWTSVDGITFAFQEVIPVVTETVWMNPFAWFDPVNEKWMLYHKQDGASDILWARESDTIAGLASATDIFVALNNPSNWGTAAVSVMYWQDKYWLITEWSSATWYCSAYVGSSPYKFSFCSASNPVLSDDEACPIHLVGPDGTKAYLFTSYDLTNWYQRTYSVLDTYSGTGVSSTTGKHNEALDFDGADDVLVSPYNQASPIDPTNGVSIALWAKFDAFTNQAKIIAQRSTWNETSGVYLQIDTVTAQGLEVRGRTSNYARSMAITNGWITAGSGTWHYIVATLKDATATNKIYVDSVDRTTSEIHTDALANSTKAVTIGSDPAFGVFFNGQICEALIVEGVLTSDEISNLYNNYGDVTLEEGKVHIRKWAATSAPTFGAYKKSVTNTLFDEVIEQLEQHSVSTNWIEYEFCEAGLADWTPLDEVLENLEK